MTTYDILSKAILQVSDNLNKKALKETIENKGFYDDLNDLMFKYYKRIHRRSDNGFYNIYTFDKNNKEDLEDFKTLKQNLNMKNYKTDYDYKNGSKIKQKNTYCIVEYNNGFMSFGSYALNVYDFIEAHDIKEDL